MANFLIASEPEVGAQDAQAAAVGAQQQRTAMATNALVAQYGNQAADPTMWQGDVTANEGQQLSPVKVQAAQDALQQQQLATRRDAELRAAQGVQAAVQKGMDPGAAYDQIVGPNAASLGLSEADSATMRAHIVQDPKNLDGIVASLAGSPKPEGMPVMFNKADGTPGAAYITDRGTTVQMDLPQGAQIRGKVSGAPIQVDMGGGKYALVQHDQYGRLTATDISGTPLSAETAQAAIQRANAMQQNADTNSYSAGVRGNNSEFGGTPGSAPGAPAGGVNGALKNAIIGQESAGNPSVGNSSAGARGVGQIMPSTFAQFARPGESISNPADNAAVSGRILDHYMAAYGNDPARAAVAYFSGPGNVAPPGSPTPYLHDAKDTDGTRTSAYVQQVLGRMGGSTAQPAAAQASDTTPAPGNGPLFNRLPPKGKLVAVSQASSIVNSADQLRLADGMVDTAMQLAQNPMATGLGQFANGFEGLNRPAYNLAAQVKSLQSLGLQTWIGSMKNAAGSTGMGRILQSEANAAMTAYGNLDPGQDREPLLRNLQIFRNRLHELQTTAEVNYKQQWGVDPYTASGQPQGGSGQGAPAPAAAGWRIVGVR
jgi:hypothetical protein